MDYFDLKNADILVVDDQVINLQIINKVLQNHYNVFVARSGEAALAQCYKHRPHIILLDVYMPGLSGLEVCQRLKSDSLYQDIPILFITSLQDADEENACWEAGGVDFVRKPINEATLLNRVKAHLTLKFQSDVLRRAALLDGLTSVYNRRHFDQQVEVEWERCQQHDLPFAVAMIDVDYFKSYNDYYGHVGGDDCLKAIAKAIESCVPNGRSFFARYGGEEFALVVSGETASNIQLIIDAVLCAVRALALEHSASDAKGYVTVSLGCCIVLSREPSVLLCEAIAAADKYLYQAKENGRDNAISGPISSS